MVQGATATPACALSNIKCAARKPLQAIALQSAHCLLTPADKCCPNNPCNCSSPFHARKFHCPRNPCICLLAPLAAAASAAGMPQCQCSPRFMDAPSSRARWRLQICKCSARVFRAGAASRAVILFWPFRGGGGNATAGERGTRGGGWRSILDGVGEAKATVI